MEPDFSGYATKANLRCSDGRTIMPDAFKHQDSMTVPLVWQHAKDSPSNVLGYAKLEHRADGVYAHGFFNDTPKGKDAKELVRHGDITALSIFANKLVEKSKSVYHGEIREVSLVMAGANPGARIEFVNLAHADGSIEELEDEAVIYTGLELEHSDDEKNSEEEEKVEHAAGDSVGDVFDSMSDEQKNVVYYMIAEALKESAGSLKQSDLTEDSTIPEIFESFNDVQHDAVRFLISEAIATTEAEHAEKEGSNMKHNIFDGNGSGSEAVLSHSEQEAAAKSIFEDARKRGSLKEAVQHYFESNADSLEHGINDIELLFPDAKNVTATPEWDKRRTEWVAGVLTGTRHTPFSRIKSMSADITLDEARAKGYVKGSLKKEEFFGLSRRITTPQTIYKKQKLDRDDVLDITDFDVVAWMRGEMRLMLEEELARAILFGDGREVDDEDKIKEDHIRPIAKDDDLYVTRLYVNLGDAESSAEEVIDTLTLRRRHWRGTGTPTLYCTETLLAQMLLIKDGFKRRVYNSLDEIKTVLRVANIVPVEALEGNPDRVVGILVNLQDYTVGADRGGETTLFEDFDIDYNQQKYLLETRVSGALTRLKSAMVLVATEATDELVDPVRPTWNGTNHSVTVATTDGVVYKNKLTNATLTTGSPVVLESGDRLTVIAVPQSGYYFTDSTNDEFEFDYDQGPIGTR
jgi:HK97 family phage prohead protease